MSHPGEHLTPREWQIATQLLAGAGNRDIARRFRVPVFRRIDLTCPFTVCSERTAAAAARVGVLRPKVSQADMLAPIRALVEAAPTRRDCRYAVPGQGRKVLIDLEELRRALAEAEAAA